MLKKLALDSRASSGFQNAQFQRLANGLSPIDHIQLAQNFLYMVLHGQRADIEDGADFEVALAKIDLPKDLLLSRRYLSCFLCQHSVVALRAPAELGPHPRRMQEGRHQTRQVGMPVDQQSRATGKGKETGHPAFAVVRPMGQNLRGLYPLKLLREGSSRKCRVAHIANHRSESTFFPHLDEVRHDRGIPKEHVAENRLFGCDHGKAIGAHCLGIAVAQRANQDLVSYKALQQSLRPTEKMGTLVHPQRRIQVEHERFDLEIVQAWRCVRRIAFLCKL